MTRLIFLVFLAITFQACNQHQQVAATSANDSFSLSGTLTGLGNDTLFLVHRTDNGTFVDTAIARNDSFLFTGKCPEPWVYKLEWQLPKTDTTMPGMLVADEIFIENTSIHISGDADKPESLKITGSSAQKDYDAYQALTKQLDDAMGILETAMRPLYLQNKKKEMAPLEATYDSLEERKALMTVGYIAQNKTSFATPFITLRNLAIDTIILSRLDSVYQMMDTAVQNSHYGKQLHDFVAALKQTETGAPAPEFTMNDTAGKPVSLASFKGKVLLIDFWASWCGPCRRENPNVVKAYKKFHSKGFEILGVSLDEKHDKWVAAIAKDNLSWRHVSDLKGWNNSAAKQYAVRSIPNNYLLDKNGIIIAKGLRGDELEKKLAQVL
jgi:peroxiredoxin